jgi:phage baseplate assembly protein V
MDLSRPRAGEVTGYDPDSYCAKVKIQPEGVTTGWIPIGAEWIGNGWGMFAPPSLGDQVEVEFLEGNFELGIVKSRIFSDVQRPVAVESGEFWLLHKLGQSVKLMNSGAVAIDDGHGAAAVFNGDGTITSEASTWNHTGPINVDGDVTSTGTVTATVDAIGGGISLKTHVHGGVLPGGATTGLPE